MFNRVLLVDDSKSARFALRKLLENNGLAVDMAANAEEALGYLDDHQPDLIFMDHFMPGMDGFEAAETIKGQPRTSAIPIIMCTSKDDADYFEQARAHGATDILPKPATPAALSEVLDKLETTVELIKSEQPINEPHFDSPAQTEMVDISESTPLFENVPTLDEVVIPVDEVRDVAHEVVHQVSEDMVANQVAAALESKLPELREAVMSNFDTVVKSMIKGYLEEAKTQAQQEFTRLIADEANKVAQRVCAETLETNVQAHMVVVQEAISKEMNEQVSEIYSNIGELKANQQLKKVSPELMEDILERAGDIAIEQANESLLRASDIAEKAAEKAAQGLTEKALSVFREESDAKITRSLESGFESARQEAAEVAWQKIEEDKAEVLGAIDKMKDRATLALSTGLLALAAAGYQFLF